MMMMMTCHAPVPVSAACACAAAQSRAGCARDKIFSRARHGSDKTACSPRVAAAGRIGSITRTVRHGGGRVSRGAEHPTLAQAPHNDLQGLAACSACTQADPSAQGPACLCRCCVGAPAGWPVGRTTRILTTTAAGPGGNAMRANLTTAAATAGGRSRPRPFRGRLTHWGSDSARGPQPECCAQPDPGCLGSGATGPRVPAPQPALDWNVTPRLMTPPPMYTSVRVPGGP
eukprot:scaffold56_cov379-Prasinococcus_capsulatus_cf.AAC.4